MLSSQIRRFIVEISDGNLMDEVAAVVVLWEKNTIKTQLCEYTQ